MKNDVTAQDEERTMILEKEKDSVRTIFSYNDFWLLFVGCTET